jgi:hypothetical protein
MSFDVTGPEEHVSIRKCDGLQVRTENFLLPARESSKQTVSIETG